MKWAIPLSQLWKLSWAPAFSALCGYSRYSGIKAPWKAVHRVPDNLGGHLRGGGNKLRRDLEKDISQQTAHSELTLVCKTPGRSRFRPGVILFMLGLVTLFLPHFAAHPGQLPPQEQLPFRRAHRTAATNPAATASISNVLTRFIKAPFRPVRKVRRRSAQGTPLPRLSHTVSAP